MSINPLKELSKQVPKDFDEYFDTLFRLAGGEANDADKDRAAALVSTAILEHALRIAISRHFKINDAQEKVLFEDYDAPLRDLSRKIKLAFSLGLLTEDEVADCNLIRKIRNLFAHSPMHFRFETKEVAIQCQKLKSGGMKLSDAQRGERARFAFVTAVGLISWRFYSHLPRVKVPKHQI
jgi:mannitol operon repressor